MFRFFVAIIAFVLFTHDSFAACSAGYYEKSVNITFPTSKGNSMGYYSNGGSGSNYNYTSPALSQGQWRVTWNSSGIAIGEASCNGTKASSGSNNSMSTTTGGQYCWCRVTSWTPDGGTSQSLPAAWVFNRDFGSKRLCANECAGYCATDVSDPVSAFRSAVFGAVQPTCTACPDGGTSTGSGDITSCYIPSTTEFTDSKGTYHFTNACYYQ